jgi:hypothetical protein
MNYNTLIFKVKSIQLCQMTRKVLLQQFHRAEAGVFLPQKNSISLSRDFGDFS